MIPSLALSVTFFLLAYNTGSYSYTLTVVLFFIGIFFLGVPIETFFMWLDKRRAR